MMTYDELPQPRLFQDEMNGLLFLEMEHNGKIAQERLPLHFLKMDEDQQAWHLQSHKIVNKLFKKLGLRMPG